MNAQPERRDRTLRGRVLPRRWLLACALALAAAPALADAVTDWNATASSVVPRLGGPQQQSRGFAIAQIAVHDALNSIHRRYDTYSVVGAASPSASPQAAVAAAARSALLGLLASVPDSPEKAAAIDNVNASYSAALAAIADGTAKNQGIAAGEAAASAILSLRAGDGSATPHLPYTLAPAPGVYQPTPNPEFPAQITPSFAGWANVTPFALASASQFRPGRSDLLNLRSKRYTMDYNEVKSVGDALVRAAAPDSAETDIARFWPGGGSNWNLSARGIVAGLGLDLWQHARLFALLNIAETDGLIANLDAKYHYNFWRPVTAIRWEGGDGNPGTESVPGWRPLLVTPPYPDYPCALPTATGASTSVLRQVLGTDDVAFSRTFAAGPVPLPAPLLPLPAKSITRQFDSLSQAADEAASARVFAGIHFRSGCRAGVRLGRQVAEFVHSHYLTPVKPEPSIGQQARMAPGRRK